jgi:hypothetical protein
MAKASQASMQGRSMNSMATGRRPARMIALTHSPAVSLRSKAIITGRAPSGRGRMRKVASVTTPSCPSDPQTTARRSSPSASPVSCPSSTTVPSISTMVTPRRLLVVTPYFRQCAPPEFMAMLPAMAQASCEEGSGA